MNDKNDQAKETAAHLSAEGKKKNSGLIFFAAFILVVIALILALNVVLQKKWPYKESAAQQIVQGFYKEEKNSIDVLCLGQSTIRNGVSGLEMFSEYGFTTYSRATSIQLPMISYYLLQEALETQDGIQAVVMDSTALDGRLFDQNKDTMSGKIHEAVDFMPLSSYKVQMIREINELGYDSSMLDYIFPLYAYHDRWEEIGEEDFTSSEWGKDYCYKGQFPTITTANYKFDEVYMSPTRVDPTFKIDERVRGYYEKMVKLCNERGIKFVLVKTPVRNWSVYKHDIIDAFAQELGVTFIDYNLEELRDEIKFNAKEDFADSGNHTNITGAKKISDHLGAYLASVCSFTDKREDPKFESWHRDCEKYQNLLTDAKLSRESNLIAFLSGLKNPNYITMLATRYDTSLYYNTNVESAFEELGIEAPFGETECLSYVALLDGGGVVYQETDPDPLDNENLISYSTTYDGHNITISSQCTRLTDNNATIVFDDESLARNTQGFNFVVYDRSVNQIVIRKTFNTGVNGTNYLTPNELADLASDPISFLQSVGGEDYITVIGVCGVGSKYIPFAVNEQLEDMGLIPLDGEFDRPYLAVLDSNRIVFNEHGESGGEISEELTVGDIPVTAISSSDESGSEFFVMVGGERFKTTKQGLCVFVYNKTTGKRAAYNRFAWGANYVTGVNYAASSNLRELIVTALDDENDIICLYSPELDAERLDPDDAAVLREYGLADFSADEYYMGVLSPQGEPVQDSSAEPIQTSVDLGGRVFDVTCSDLEKTVSSGNVVYRAPNTGLYLLVYHRDPQAVIVEKTFASATAKKTTIFDRLQNDPLTLLDTAVNGEYITVIGAGIKAAEYMPGSFNDALKQLGLLPMDKTGNRPYLAVLNGSEIVYNAYGEKKAELSTEQIVNGHSLLAVSNADDKQHHVHITVDDDTVNLAGSGLIVSIYDAQSGENLFTKRYFWASNYVTGTNYSNLTNVSELFATARYEGNAVLCLYVGEGDEGAKLSGDIIEVLKKRGLDNITDHLFDVAVIYPDGVIDRSSGAEGISHTFTIGERKLKFTADGDGMSVRLRYSKLTAPGKAGLYILIYNAEADAILYDAWYELG